MDGLRGLTALWILLAHVWLNLGTAASLGPLPRLFGHAPQVLLLFFVLSAFLLYRPFLEAGFAGRPAGVRRYARGRVRRILPAYLVVLLVSGLVLGVATTAPFRVDAGMPPTLPETGWLWEHPLLGVIDAALLQTLLPGTMMTGIGPAWTLTVEVCFYLLLPALAGLAFAVGSRRLGLRASVSAWLGPALLVTVGVVAKWVHVHVLLDGLTPVEAFFADWGPTWQAVFARSVLVQADAFGIGLGAAILFLRWHAPERGQPRAGRARGRLAVLVAIAAAGVATVALLPTWADTGWALLWAALLLLVATQPPGAGLGRVAAALDWGPVRWAGERAYGVYLWHLPVILLLARLGWNAPATTVGFLLNCALVLGAVCALADLTWRYVERPLLQRRV